MYRPEINNLVAQFRGDLIAECERYRGSKAVGAVGAFIASIEAHRAEYAKKLASICMSADAATNNLCNEIKRTIDDLAQQEIQRVRAAGRVELNPEWGPDQRPPQPRSTAELIKEPQRNLAPVERKIIAEESTTEKYNPPDRREQRSDIERIMILEEGETAPIAENLHAAVETVASMSSAEIDRVIGNALDGLRANKPDEDERVSHDTHQLRSKRSGNGDEPT
jgi:hypothetical protein